MKLLRTAGLVVAGALAVGFAVPYIDAGGYRERIERALERALDRKVTVGKVRFNLLTGPGFTVDDVTIHDHPSIGIEPMAYVETLDARVRLTTLWTRSLSFSNLRLNNPTVNLSKSDAGVWNFQLLGQNMPASQFPSIQVRSGRINFKFGDYKTIFYLSDSDVDVTPVSPDRLDLRFSGQPARTDQQVQSFGRLLARGVWRVPAGGPAELDANLELERSGIPDLVRLVEGHAVRLHGAVSSRARIAGPVTALKVRGELRLDDVRRWDMVPMRGGTWDLAYGGTVDLERQRIELQTEPGPETPFAVRFRATDYLAEPKSAAIVEVKEAPASAFLEIARHMGATLPPELAADGKVTGTVGYAKPGGMQGQFVLENSKVQFEQTSAIEFERAEFVVSGTRFRILPSAVTVGAGQTAELEGEYDGSSGELYLDISTRGMNVAELQTGSEHLFGAGGVPVLEWCRQGLWRGSVRYERSPDAASWSGEFDLQNARIHVDGLDSPVKISSAHVKVEDSQVALHDIRGTAGTIAFTGEYGRSGSLKRPERLRLRIHEAKLADIEALLTPTLRRERGLLVRFRLGRPQIPEWLRSRNLAANVVIESLTIGDQTWAVDHVRVAWEGMSIKLAGLAARNGETELAGAVALDLSGAVPHYRIEGKLEGVEYQGGALQVNGVVEARGLGDALLESAKGTGSFSGDHLLLSPELEFRTMSGTLELLPGGRLRLNSIQAAHGLESYTGQGTGQTDGKIILDLTTGKRQVRVAVAK